MTVRARASVPAGPAGRPVRLGLRANLAQFCLLVAVNALVGGTLGQERTVVPLLATQVFHLSGYLAAFGLVKAATNFVAGTLSDRFGRKPVLVADWLAAVPIQPCRSGRRAGAGSSPPTSCSASTKG